MYEKAERACTGGRIETGFEEFIAARMGLREKIPDYGIDVEVEIVEEEKVTNKVLWLQLKATENKGGDVFYQMQTNHLKYYEGCHLPVLILYWIKSENEFCCVFAQEYIEELSRYNPSWREQKTVKIRFDSKVKAPGDLESIATDGYLYILKGVIVTWKSCRGPVGGHRGLNPSIFQDPLLRSSKRGKIDLCCIWQPVVNTSTQHLYEFAREK
ncbi:MAG: DUF4365 domain-containing protein [Theionarchaea archaeon]|nr:MAG: hypothetical protein AYK18_02425 [Theionarchaea archaeon DG-70]MBU7012152.1 DUF4365 domain-containing protein [Theionarchaea archaeon]